MILTLLVWLYITFICFSWGNIILNLVTGRTTMAQQHEVTLPLVCFTGLAAIGLIAFVLSLFIPLGFTAHVLFAIPAVAFALISGNRKKMIRQIKQSRLPRSSLLLFVSCVLLILIINTYRIIHPDTLSYHAQAIRWMETYKAVPGLVHLDVEVAMQSIWFALMAIFRFQFLYPSGFLFVNGVGVCWFCLFVCQKLARHTDRIANRSNYTFFLWLALLAYCFLSWTQVRLTAASASPDFIGTLFIWMVFYCFHQKTTATQHIYSFLIILFCSAAISIKLSAITVLLFGLIIAIQYIKEKEIKSAIISLAALLLLLAPLIIRNILASGYPLYPSTLPDLIQTQWKPDREVITQFQHYITAYARFPVDSYEQAEEMLQLSILEWLPPWWHNLTVVNRCLLFLVGFLFLANVITLKRQLQKKSFKDFIIVAVSFTGSAIWFLNAPDPRFGTGFLIPLTYGLLSGLINLKKTTIPSLKTGIYKIPLWIACILLSGYTIYRAVYFFGPGQWLLPQGIQDVSNIEYDCNGIKVHIPSKPNSCGFISVPCSEDSCKNFQWIGGDIETGLKAR